MGLELNLEIQKKDDYYLCFISLPDGNLISGGGGYTEASAIEVAMDEVKVAVKNLEKIFERTDGFASVRRQALLNTSTGEYFVSDKEDDHDTNRI
jgi:hypothetical protein